MAKKPKANSHDNTIRNVIIGFCVLILIVGTALVWNNRDLNHVGTVDGERMTLTHLNFYFNEAQEQLMFQFQMQPSIEMESWAREIAFDTLVDLYVVTGRAAGLGVALTDEDQATVQELVDLNRQMFVIEEFDIDMISAMGFSDRTFRQFVEKLVLYDLVREHALADFVLDEVALTEAYEQYLEENFLFLTDVMVHYIEVETQTLAESILTQMVTAGTSFAELMREHSIAYEPGLMPVDDDGEIIETVNVRFTNLAQNTDHLALAYGMEVGNISSVLELDNGNFAIIEIVEINEMVEDFEEFEREFREWQEGMWREESFRDIANTWRAEANIARNTRIMGPEPDFE